MTELEDMTPEELEDLQTRASGIEEEKRRKKRIPPSVGNTIRRFAETCDIEPPEQTDSLLGVQAIAHALDLTDEEVEELAGIHTGGPDNEESEES